MRHARLPRFALILILVSSAAPFFAEVSWWEFLTGTTWKPLMAHGRSFGVWPLLAGTLITSAIALAVAIPLGLLAAIYLSEFAAPRTRTWLKPALELLAGVPTVVYGFLALTVVTPALRHIIPGLQGFNALAPGLVMGIMIMPYVSSLAEDAIFAVPRALREAATGLGADKLTTIFRVVLPSASSGILAAITLAASRALGETMIVAMAAGQATRLSFDPREPMQTQTAFIAELAKGDVPTGSLGYLSIFAVGLLLSMLTLGMNLLSATLIRRMRGRSYHA